MGINGINSQLTDFLNIIALEKNKTDLDEPQAKQKDLLTKPAPLDKSGAANSDQRRPDPSNLMSGNFMDQDKEQSKYIKARLNSFAIANQYANKKNSMIDMLDAQKDPDPDKKYVDALLAKIRAQRLMRERMNRKVTEESKANLKQNTEDLEQAANKALAPKDANGKPIETAEKQNQVDESGAIKAALAQSSSITQIAPSDTLASTDMPSAQSTATVRDSDASPAPKVSIDVKV